MVFPVITYGCESWTIKKAKHWRIDAFELWFWRRLLRVPWTSKRSNQSILKEISPAYSFEGLMLKLKLQLLWSPHATNWLIGKDRDVGRDWRQEEEKGMTEDETVGWHHQLNGHEFEQTLGVSDGQEAWRAAVHGVSKSRTGLSNWTDWRSHDHFDRNPKRDESQWFINSWVTTTVMKFSQMAREIINKQNTAVLSTPTRNLIPGKHYTKA